MKRINCYRATGMLLGMLLLTVTLHAQTVTASLQKTYAAFEKDPQLKYASHSLYVVELATGKPVFAKNSEQGLAPASTQKVVTAAAAYAMLGGDFTYKTVIDFDRENQQLLVYATGDPALGSTRFAITQPESILTQIADSLQRAGIRSLQTQVQVMQPYGFDFKTIPDGWIVQDIGNYYGAGVSPIIWRENQFELLLKSSAIRGKEVVVVNNEQLPDEVSKVDSYLKSAPAGSGDNAYIYLPLDGNKHTLHGTIPVSQNKFSINGAVVNGERYFLSQLRNELLKRNLINDTNALSQVQYSSVSLPYLNSSAQTGIARFQSPTIDTLAYWFLRKSINLYGEAFVKTMGEKMGAGWNTESGLQVMREFWSGQKIDSFALRMQDGSGLSPQNRVTTKALVQVLQYARSQKWYSSYVAGFPIYNGMQMKSGTINAVKGFCGYHKSKKDGKEYVFAFLVNNFSGSSSSLVKKMYVVLDSLK